MAIIKLIPLSENGKRVGESHPKAKISDKMVDDIRAMHEDDGIPGCKIAAILNLNYQTVMKIIRYERRCNSVRRYKKVVVEE